MEARQGYNRWLETNSLEHILRKELEEIQGGEAEISDRFYRHLAFGTGGLRGKLGAGTNRMNIYTVGKATQGLADYLLEASPAPIVCIAYDTRNMSAEFALHAARILCANGVMAYLYDTVHPTPILSYAVRHMKAQAGIVITASHNPREYNGYKVYGPDGGQITDKAAAAILARIDATDLFEGVRLTKEAQARQSGLLRDMPPEVDSAYFERVKALILRKDLVEKEAKNLKILYTPLHGSGNLPVRRVLGELGFSQVAVVPEQEMPDGDFPTTPYPNPEEPAVFELAIGLAKKSDPDLIFATDPDGDRIGVLVKDDRGEYSVLTGNQVGALLCSYIIQTRKELGILPENAAVVKTIVTTDLAQRICEESGVTLIDTLTGFKYIGEKIGRWEDTGENTFLFGFEESYGYLAGTFVRDKDAVIAAALIAEMALYYKNQGLSLYGAVQKMYETYGCTAEKLISATMPGAQGQDEIAAILAGLRENHRGFFQGEAPDIVEDYQTSIRSLADGTTETLELPKSNVLKFIFSDGSWLVLRPSGTEPKIKVYIYAAGSSHGDAQGRVNALTDMAQVLLKLRGLT